MSRPISNVQRIREKLKFNSVEFILVSSVGGATYDRKMVGPNPALDSAVCPWARHFTGIVPIDSAENENMAKAREPTCDKPAKGGTLADKFVGKYCRWSPTTDLLILLAIIERLCNFIWLFYVVTIVIYRRRKHSSFILV